MPCSGLACSSRRSLYVTFVASTRMLPQDIAHVPMQLFPGTHGWDAYRGLEQRLGGHLSVAAGALLLNSLIVALVVTFGKISVSLPMSCRYVPRGDFFWMIFITLMLPVEVRIRPIRVTDLKLINSYAGLTCRSSPRQRPLLFRQFFLTIPDELVEAAKIDGAGPLRFFRMW